MEFKLEVYKEIDFLSRLLTSNPYTAEGKSILNGLEVNLSVEDFFDKDVYAKPFFLNEKNGETSHAEDTDEEDSSDKEDYIFVSDDHSLSINAMIKQYENFQESFNNLHEFPLLFVRGGSGTGKSTFMYSLIHELTKSNPNVFHTELTLEKYIENQYYCGIKLPELPDSAIYKFIRIIFAKIITIVTQFIKANDADQMKAILVCYHKTFMNYFGENPTNKNFFETLCGKESCQLDYDEHCKKVVKQGIKFLEDDSSRNILRDLTMLLIELCYCLNPLKFNLITFDGIEYLINRKHHIYDPDINDILFAFDEVKRGAEDLFAGCNLRFADCFKIVLAVRNATLDYCDKREQEDIRDSNISADVTDWYRMEDIYEKRIKYFSENEHLFENDLAKIKDIVDIVVNDVRRGKERASGAMDMLERMYNFDKRSLQSNLLSAISQIVLSGSEAGILKNKFSEFYYKRGPLLYNKGKQGYTFRYLWRRALIRILFNRIEYESHGTFFDGVYFSELGDECMPSSYLRKMLIFLMHNQVSDNRIKDEYVPFNSVFDAIARTKPNGVIEPQTIEKIAILIYRLSDFRLHDSAWQQLISIKFNLSDNQPLSNEKQFVSKVIELHKSNSLDDDRFGIRLNYAGAFLAYIQSDFEFFACRCKKFRVPLIFSNDVEYITSLLEEVHDKAANCMNMVIEDEKSIFGRYREMYQPDAKYLYRDDAYKTEGRLLSHPKRIINNHIMYLEHYRYFIEEVHGILDAEEKKSIINKINAIIAKYKRDYNDLVDGYGSADGDFFGAMYLKDYDGIPYLYQNPKI